MKNILKKNKYIRYLYYNFFAPHKIELEDIDIKKIAYYQEQILKRLRATKVLKVAFFISTAAKWKYDHIYKMMLLDKKFEPIIIVVPMHAWGKEFMLEEMDKTYTWFKERDYNTLAAYNIQTNKFLNLKKEIVPDMIFYSEPYEFVGKEYFITNFYKTALTCHVQYAFMSDDNYQAFYNRVFHNLLWAFFAETSMHKEFSKKYALNKGVNVIVTGYPHCDVFIDKSYRPVDVWKKAKKNHKRIIWAPHHTIDEEGGWGNFLDNYEFMLSLANKYKEKIFFTFKPHPNLKPRLYRHKDWGKEKTDLYYNNWINMENTQLHTDDYVDLFLTSDALIHDCGSFIAEYLYVNKPVIFLYKNADIINQWNEFGKTALDKLYKSFSNDDIITFIENVVLDENDYKKNIRYTFIEDVLLPYNKQLASKNIVDYIKNTINERVSIL